MQICSALFINISLKFYVSMIRYARPFHNYIIKIIHLYDSIVYDVMNT